MILMGKYIRQIWVKLRTFARLFCYTANEPVGRPNRGVIDVRDENREGRRGGGLGWSAVHSPRDRISYIVLIESKNRGIRNRCNKIILNPNIDSWRERKIHHKTFSDYTLEEQDD